MTGSVSFIVIDLVLKASAILGATAGASLLLRRSSASARHLVWTLGLAGSLAIPALSTAVPRWQLPIVHLDSAPVANNGPIGLAPAALETREPASSVSVPHAGSTIPAPAIAQRRAQTWSIAQMSLVVWIVGAILILGRLLLGLGLVARMTRRTRQVTNAAWLPQARRLADALGLRRVRFVRGRSASMPMACGLFRAVVLMPVDADGWPGERLRIVLLHELAHVKRRDCLTHAIAQLACAAYWFNPLVWIAAKRLRVERERACDDLVLRAGTRGTEYADQLLEIARVMQEGRFPAVLGGATLAMAHRSQLEGRLMAILDPSVSRRALTRLRIVTAAGAAFVIVLVLASVQPWAQTPASQPLSAQSASTAVPVVQPSTQLQPQPQRQARNTRGLEPRDIDQIQDGIREGIRQGIGRGIGTGVGVGADIASGVVASIVQSVATSVATGVSGGISGGVTGGVTTGVVDGVNAIAEGVTTGLQNAAPVLAQDRSDRAQSTTDDRRRGDSRAAAALIEALKDSDKGVRETALAALVNMRDPRIFDPLTVALKDSNADIREKAAFGLGQLRDARAIEPLSAALHDSSADVREQAVFALGQIRDRRATGPLASALKDESAGVRKQAAFALGELRDPDAVDPLVGALHDSTPEVRAQAAFALGQIRDARAVDGLSAALKDSNVSVRRQAAFALGQIR